MNRRHPSHETPLRPGAKKVSCFCRLNWNLFLLNIFSFASCSLSFFASQTIPYRGTCSSFPTKVASEMTTGEKGKLFNHSSHSCILLSSYSARLHAPCGCALKIVYPQEMPMSCPVFLAHFYKGVSAPLHPLPPPMRVPYTPLEN